MIVILRLSFSFSKGCWEKKENRSLQEKELTLCLVLVSQNNELYYGTLCDLILAFFFFDVSNQVSLYMTLLSKELTLDGCNCAVDLRIFYYPYDQSRTERLFLIIATISIDHCSNVN